MTIKLKLLGGGIAVSLVLLAVLLLTLYSFATLSDGFREIVEQANTGVDSAKSTEANVVQADADLTRISVDMLGIGDDINRTNMTVKMLERKLIKVSASLTELAESLDGVAGELPDGLARDAAEDAKDAVGDIEESVRREALISLTDTVKKMNQFALGINGQVEGVKSLTEELGKVKALSARVLTANQAINALSKQFGVSIGISRNIIAAVLSLVALVTLIFVFLLTRSIIRPLHRSIEIAQGIAAGELNQNVDIIGKDETGQLGSAMAVMIANLKSNIDETQQRAEAATRIRLALDVGRTNVLVADADGKIIYVNQSAYRTLQEGVEELQQDLPGFDPEQLLDSNIWSLHMRPEEQRKAVQALTEEQREDLEIGGRSLRLITNPVFNADRERIGTVVEFTDRTAEVAVEREVEEIVGAARHGNLERRIEVANKQGFFKSLGEDVNQLLTVASETFNDIASVMENLSRGDLSHKITRNYQGTYAVVQARVNSTIDQLQEIVGSISTSAKAINTATREVAAGNNSMSKRTEQQATRLEETASSTDELTSTVHSNADNAQLAKTLAGSARELAEQGGLVIGDAIGAMNAIHESSDRIAEIIGVIDEISFQTNLLALNASVEAARAGEHGRGFAVVATEVRNLAQRSAAEAREIKNLIQDSGEKVRAGVNLVNQSGSTLEEIVNSVKKVGDIIVEIAAASREQSQGLEQVNKAVREMDEMTQQNAALAEETSAASASMTEQVQMMTESLQFFKVG
ncbi:MAG: HAMP domain-containing protein [Chromatiaceae bacterium]|nr:HAMP domain-containing protein [Chromatiaceae bacterium]MCP5447466.1 HAMP domain-containing protein [Chromatiaceae bacterium]